MYEAVFGAQRNGTEKLVDDNRQKANNFVACGLFKRE